MMTREYRKPFLVILLIAWWPAVSVVRGEEVTYGFLHPEKIQPDGYTLTLERVQLVRGELSRGIFRFRWSGPNPIRIWCLGTEKDGVFRVAFENSTVFDGEKWSATNYGHCGTGAELVTFQPGSYFLVAPIVNFHQAVGEMGVVGIEAESVTLVSKPFPLSFLEQAVEASRGLAHRGAGKKSGDP